MRAGALTATAVVVSLCAVPGSRGVIADPRPEPHLEASVFVGVGSFSDDTELGNSWAPEQVPRTSAVLGGRVGWVALPSLFERGALRAQLGVEGELAIAPAFTGDVIGGRMSYFAPVFGWHAHGLLRFVWPDVQAHLVAGAGGETVASSSPFMSKETDPVVYWGPGVALPVTGRWLLRLDARHGVMPGRDDGMTSTISVQVGVATRFGTPSRPRIEPERVPVPDPTPPPVADADRDGVLDAADRCPDEPETVNQLTDDDGCPELDPDGDGVFDAADRCPDDAEDRDGFMDDDGCPDLDNDGDMIADAQDRCPVEPETRNGITDDDGCADQLPAAVTAALAAAGKLAFTPASARVTPAAQQILKPLLVALREHRALAIRIVAHPATAKDVALARRRADAVKWFLVDEGVIASQIVVEVGAVARSPIEITLAPLP
ncbi:MAG: OmpA family protein [Deltaproteobacteria bacterium]|nr:OmpA family protein [Deltaproteobacteria bacterium]